MAIPRSDETGPSATDVPELLPVLRRAWESPFTTRSDFARANTELVAIAACLGLLTVMHHNTLNEWGNNWRITARGLRLLETIE
jgi:hypothetical protein